VTHARDARAAKLLTLRFGDGSVDASVDDGAGARPVERRPRQSYIGRQPGLFDGPEES
jgi:exodeoxyribonuclease VII large subunit